MATGGGYDVTGGDSDDSVSVSTNKPVIVNGKPIGWLVSISYDGESDEHDNVTLTAYVLCAPAA